jgi:Ca2+/Na+ antiporter
LLKRRPLFRDIFFYGIALALLALAMHDGVVSLSESVALLAVYVCYIIVIGVSPHVRRRYRVQYLKKPAVMRQRSFVEEREESMALSSSSALLPAANADIRDGGYTMLESGLVPASISDGGVHTGGVHPEGVYSDGVYSQTGEQEKRRGMGEDDDGDDDAVDLPHPTSSSTASRSLEIITWPLRRAFSLTTPLCERGSPSEGLYVVTLIVSFLWVSLFSFVLSAVVQRWGKLTGVPLAFFGFALVALGAEIPDTVQSVTVARRGYGSMAVSNAVGSQILNICIGLGLPWTAALMAGKPISVSDHREIMVAVELQALNVICATAILLGVALVMRQSKVELKRSKGVFMVAMFFFIQTAYALFLFVPSVNQLFSPGP